MTEALGEVGSSGLGPQFPAFVDVVAAKAVQEGIEADPLTPKLSLLARRLGQTMLDDSNREVYKPAGWSHASYRMCITLWAMGPLPSHRVTAMTNMSRATVSAALKRCVDEGYVTKEASADDGRSVTVELTPLGEERIRQTYSQHLAFEREWFNVLTDVEKQLLVMLIEKLLATHE